MILIPIIGLLVGVLFAFVLRLGPIPGTMGQYLAISCLAGLDTVCGGIRSALEQKFRSDVFITGFFSNCLIAFFLSWLGDKILINLFLAVALVLGGRIFNNLSLIRRFMLTKWNDNRERKEMQAALQASANAQIESNS